jgi:uncharacterized protein DUF839
VRKVLAGAAALAALCGFTHGPLIVGPGSGVRTHTPAMVRPLREDVSVTPIFTVGDSLSPPDTVSEAFFFAPEPDGLGIRKAESGLLEVYVAHELDWNEGYNGARVSRLAIDRRNLGVMAGDYLIDGSEGFTRFCAASLVGAHEGFLAPMFLVNEEAIDGIHVGVVAAVDVRNGAVSSLPWLGHFSHEQTIIVPVSSGKLVAILTEDGLPGESQLYMYIADNDTEFLSGQGRLYVFRADKPPGRTNTRLASLATKSRPLTGRFVPLFPDRDDRFPVSQLPSRLEAQAQGMGCLNFVRLEDAAPATSQANAFYFVDTGDDEVYDPVTGRPVTKAGRLYFARLDPFNPTIVEELRVVLDGDESDDIYRPDNIAADDRFVWIQEDPGKRGVHPSRILRYDTNTRRVEPMAECAEQDGHGNFLPRGIGGEWESTGIVDASEFFGRDTWLIAVQAHNLWLPQFRNRKGGGQLLLLRGPGSSRPKPPEAKAGKAPKDGG